MPDTVKTIRERVRRRRVLLGARISDRSHSTSTDCRVRDLSDGGACLLVASPIGIPDNFNLMLTDGAVKPCKVEWRKADRIGVSFG